jgi:hypothetical protein
MRKQGTKQKKNRKAGDKDIENMYKGKEKEIQVRYVRYKRHKARARYRLDTYIGSKINRTQGQSRGAG